MSPTAEALLRSWPYEPWLLATLVLSAVIYGRGWLRLRRRNPRRWTARQPAAFGSALAVLYLALASPIEPLAALVLQAHMLQHLLLMMVAAPLVWLGDPLIPLVRGVPQSLRRQWILPLLHWPGLRELGRWLVHPAVALPLFVAANWLWHAPRAYELALSTPGWHRLEHGCFLAAALLFWHSVVRPFPGRPSWSQWLLLPYLVLADVQNTLLAALLTFSNRVLYPHYARVPPLAGLTPLDDQSAAGVLMWVPGSIAFLVPLGWIGLKLLLDQDAAVPPRAKQSVVSRQLSVAGYQPAPKPAGQTAFDLLRLPLLGRFLRWRHARLALQIPAALLAIVIVVDGLCGPQSGAMNLAGVLPWIHWRAVVVLGLLAIGNVSCMVCPFTLPRSIARRWLPAGYAWPAWLRSKWLAVALVAVFFWAYEVFDLWDRPWWTAWLVLGYFAAALAVDGLFRGAAFCKYLCPIGQFNFVQSLVSPWEVRVREPAACAACRTHDCLHGRGQLRGCELELFQPRKAGNMDCTFCLDCVHACPHDNVGLLISSPLVQLEHDRSPSGLGRLSRRPDIAALVAMLSFGAFANAAGMTAPVLEWRQRLATALDGLSPAAVTSAMFLLTWIVVPLLAVATATEISRGLGRLTSKRLPLALRYVYTLVPLGFAMWLAHYGFHFFTSYAAVVPAAQRFAGDWGSSALGQPAWACSCCGPVADWLLPAELIVLDCGLLASLAAGYRLALTDAGQPGRALRVVLPWAVLIGLLFAAGVWIVFQPMQMRGMLGGGG
ncbi:MAG TPA: cytochrome c oxidase assembly protein [Pirellulales bacterium]|jgi:cytochrome c oxidase assembly factor CtaG|nr:cytochrome c oxidase assembly protein [Pirellulales bacterium]